MLVSSYFAWPSRRFLNRLVSLAPSFLCLICLLRRPLVLPMLQRVDNALFLPLFVLSRLHAAIEELIKVFFVSISTSVLNLLLELVDVIHILALFFVLFVLLECFDCLVELFVFISLLSLFEVLNLDLLLQKLRFDFCHVLICFKHLCEEIIRSTDGDLGLN